MFNVESELAANKPKISSKSFDILRFENIFLYSFVKKNKIIDIINRYCVYPLNEKSSDSVDIWQNAIIAAIEAEVPDKNILRSSAFIMKPVYGFANGIKAINICNNIAPSLSNVFDSSGATNRQNRLATAKIVDDFGR